MCMCVDECVCVCARAYGGEEREGVPKMSNARDKCGGEEGVPEIKAELYVGSTVG